MSYKKLILFLENNNWSRPETTKKGKGWIIKTLYKKNERCVLQCKTFCKNIIRVCHLFVFDKNDVVKNEFNFINNYHWCSGTSDDCFKKLIKGE